MKVSAVMTKGVRTVKPEDTARKAAIVMNKHKIGSVVVASGRKAVGIITERDLLKRVVAKNKKADSIKCRDIMSKPLIAISADADVEDAISIMSKKGIKKLITTRHGMLVGIVTATDIIKSGEKVEYAALKKLSEFYPIGTQQTEAG